MLIRSQDKKSILNLDKVMQLCVVTPPFGTVERMIMANGVGVGTYSTEEKAIKVLDMIQEQYEKHIYGQGGQMATADYYVPPFAFIPPKVFQMPQDSEV